MFFNKNVKKTMMRMELNLTSSKVDATALSSGGFYGFEQQSIYSYFTASLAPQLFYNVYNTNTSKAFIGGGLAFSYSRYSEGTIIFLNSSQKMPSYSATNFSVLLKAGWRIKMLEVYAGYSRPVGDFFIGSEVIRNNYQIGFNYAFK
jgi:hypothetical protein